MQKLREQEDKHIEIVEVSKQAKIQLEELVPDSKEYKDRESKIYPQKNCIFLFYQNNFYRHNKQQKNR